MDEPTDMPAIDLDSTPLPHPLKGDVEEEEDTSCTCCLKDITPPTATWQEEVPKIGSSISDNRFDAASYLHLYSLAYDNSTVHPNQIASLDKIKFTVLSIRNSKFYPGMLEVKWRPDEFTLRDATIEGRLWIERYEWKKLDAQLQIEMAVTALKNTASGSGHPAQQGQT